MSLSGLDYVNGIFGLLFIILTTFLGIKIISKYFKLKDINLLYVGIFIALLSCGWYGTTASFIVALITGGDGLSFQIIVLLNFIPLPFAFIFWMLAFSNFLYKKKKFLILLLCMGYNILFFSLFLYFIFTNPVFVGEKISPVDTKANSLLFVFILFIYVLVMLFTGIKFALETMKYNEIETKLKGKLLLLAFPLYVIGALLDATMPTNALTLILFRIILMISASLFYIAFQFPKWLKSYLSKQ